MTLMAMAIALVVPNISSGQMTLLRAQMREAVAILNHARRVAIIEGKQKTVIFSEGRKEPAQPSKSLAKEGQWVSQGITLEYEQHADLSEKENNELEADEMKDNEVKENTYKITFYPEGGSSGGHFILSYLTHQAKISINPLTGQIESEILDDQN